jgi:hypothetical protein
MVQLPARRDENGYYVGNKDGILRCDATKDNSCDMVAKSPIDALTPARGANETDGARKSS